MFIELAEFLRCPAGHEETHCVLAADRMGDRTVIDGTVGCPACGATYPIVGGVTVFGRAPDLDAGEPAAFPAGAEAVRALLHLTNPGGFIVLVGSAGAMAPQLASLLEGTRVVTVNATGPAAAPGVTPVTCADGLPLRTSSARGVVLGAECARDPWVTEAVRVLLRGRRLVVADETVAAGGAAVLAVGSGLWVGERG